MPIQSDFFSTLKPRLPSISRRKDSSSSTQSGKIRPSGTSYTLNNWVDLDSNGHSSLLNVNDIPNIRANESTSHLSDGTRYNERNENQENIDIDRKSSMRSNGNRLKRKSIQLLNRMVERKHSNSFSNKLSLRSSRNQRDREEELKNSIRYPGLERHCSGRDEMDPIEYIHGFDGQDANLAGPSYSISPPPTPPTPSLITPHLPSSPYHHLHPSSSSLNHTPAERTTPINSKFLTPIPQKYTPEYHSFIGDSDSSGKRVTLKPIRSVVPNNSPCDSPLSGFGIIGNSGKKRLTFEELVQEPLPQPNGQPSRYANRRKYGHLDNHGSTSFASTHLNTHEAFEKSHGTNQEKITMEFNHLKLEDEPTNSLQQEINPIPFETSSALEALWEYGSNSSISSSSSSRSVLHKHQELQIDLDQDINLDDYPFPPGLSNLPTERSLTYGMDGGNIRGLKIAEQDKYMGLGQDISVSSAKSHSSMKLSNRPKEITIPPKLDRSDLANHLQVSSPLSDTFSLEEDDIEEEEEEEEGDTEIKQAIAFKIPLKFEKPLSKENSEHKRNSLSIDSPFIELYKVSNPNDLSDQNHDQNQNQD